MSPLAAFFVGSLATAAALTVVAERTTCPYPVSCPCGSSSKNYTFCFSSPEPKNPCERWSRCARCEDGMSNCAECHSGYTGSTCRTVSGKRSRVRRQYSTSRQAAQGYPTYSESCPELEAPKLGAIRCVQSGRYRTCTGRCLPGYTFKNKAEVEEMVLRCRRGSWQPIRSFPPCENRGLCDLELKGSGTFNCTSGMLGTRCDIICGGDMTRRHFCYPGKQWEPPLPYCIRPKDPKVAGEGRSSCRCENGGSCDASGNCICPVGRTGTYCETVVPEKQYCPDPGFIADGERRAGNGQLAQTTETFEEGQSVVFSCTGRGSALVGSSLLTCTSNGSWSASLPHCLRPTVRRVTCPDPGSIDNADRLNTDGSSSVNVQTYRVGQSVVYTCHRGYALHGPSMLTCQQSSKWSSDKPYCTQLGRPPTSITVTTEKSEIDVDYCPDPGIPRNGDRTVLLFINPRLRGFQKGSRLEYFCKSGYELVGEKNLFCQLDATWSSKTPTCQEKTSGPRGGLKYCDNPGPMFDGKVTVLMKLSERRGTTSDLTRRRRPRSDADELQYPQGTQLEYSCEEGFALRGPYLITCEATGQWSADPPSCVEECGRTFTQTIRKITNGMKTIAGEWPWVVAIAIPADNVSQSQVICGGALLDKRTVVTAAHCLAPANRYTLYFGKYHILEKYDDEKVLVRTSTQLVIHPRFNSETYNADIALIRFSPSVRYSSRIQPICLPTRETTEKHIKIGEKGYVTGWGLTEKNLQSDTLLMAHLPVLPPDSCKRAYERQGLPHAITDNMFCAGFEEGVVSACTGDSGSPLVFYDRPSDRYTLEGVVSFGVSGQCGLPGRYTAFTFVSKFVQWIIRNM